MPFSRRDWLLLDLENTIGPFRTRFGKNKGHYEVPEHLSLNLNPKVNYDMPFSRRDWLLLDLENTLGPFRTRFAKK